MIFSIILFASISLTLVTVVEADHRIKEERRVSEEYKELYHSTYNKLTQSKTMHLNQRLLNVELEKELENTKKDLLAYEKVSLDTEDELIATSESIDNIAAELCKHKDVEYFTIGVKDRNYNICGGGIK